MSETKNPNLPPGTTEGEVTKWKKEGPVHFIAAFHQGKRYVGLFRKPTLAIMHACTASNMMANGQVDPFGMLAAQYANCKLVVDPAGESIEEVRGYWQTKVAGLFKQLEGEVGEL